MSAGRLSTIVESAAYDSVEIAKHAVSHQRLVRNAAAAMSVMPRAQTTMTAFRAVPTAQPRLIRALDTPPARKLPASAARKGTQNANRLSSSLNPRETRKIANQSVMKNHTG